MRSSARSIASTTTKRCLVSSEEVEKTVPKEQEIHIVRDNYAILKHDKVFAWIERSKRIFLHAIPTSTSRVNLVQRFLATMIHLRMGCGVCTSVPHLQKYSLEYLDSHNDNPPPLIWTKAAVEGINKLNLRRAVLSKFSWSPFCNGDEDRLGWH